MVNYSRALFACLGPLCLFIMDALIVDLKEFNRRTPEQVVRVFFTLFSKVTVQAQLWEAFRWYAINDERGVAGLNGQEVELALLFDHLIDLVDALQVLREGTSAGRCVICGKGIITGDG